MLEKRVKEVCPYHLVKDGDWGTYLKMLNNLNAFSDQTGPVLLTLFPETTGVSRND